MPADSAPFVVVGIDGSEPSEHALRWGAFIAQHANARLRVVIAWLPVWPGEGPAAADVRDWDPYGDALNTLEQTVQKALGNTPGIEVDRRAVQGGAAKTLLEESASARMLVLGSRGHGGFTGLLLGSVSATCTAHATCPVLVIHGNTPAPDKAPAARY